MNRIAFIVPADVILLLDFIAGLLWRASGAAWKLVSPRNIEIIEHCRTSAEGYRPQSRAIPIDAVKAQTGRGVQAAHVEQDILEISSR